MTSDERTLISTLFDRLKQAGGQPKDAEADEYIRSKVSEQSSAPYLLVQSTLVMQQALAAAQSRIASLEKQLAEATRPSQESGGSFLSGVANLFGGDSLLPNLPLAPHKCRRPFRPSLHRRPLMLHRQFSKPPRAAEVVSCKVRCPRLPESPGELFFSKAFRT